MGSAFGVGYLDVTEGATTTNRFTSFSLGKASGSNPTGTGRVVWTGTAIGIDTDNVDGRGFWQADVTVDIDDVANPNVDLVISRGSYVNQTSSNFSSLSWDNMALTNGVFQLSHGDGDDNVWGSFYGDNYEEVGGSFDNDSTVGAFGAKK